MRELNELQRERLNEFQDTFHPRHFYCRLRDIDLDKKSSIIMAKIYQTAIYEKVLSLLEEKL